MAIYPVRRKDGITYTAVRPVCFTCSKPLDAAARLHGYMLCTDCACGLVKRDVLRPAPLRRRPWARFLKSARSAAVRALRGLLALVTVVAWIAVCFLVAGGKA